MRVVCTFLVAACAVAACRERTRLEVPGPTTARPDAAQPLLNDSLSDRVTKDAGAPARSDAGVPTVSSFVAPAAPPDVRFVKGKDVVVAGSCQRAIVAATKGKLTIEIAPVVGDRPPPVTLDAGDVLVTLHAQELRLRGDGAGVSAKMPSFDCTIDDHSPLRQQVVKGTAARELTWAKGAMHARLDVAGSISPELYVGRLEGTAPVAEHAHPGSYEVLAALEGAGTFTLDGKERRLVAPQMVVVPPGTKHAWKPDPGTKLNAIQVYGPPGPEQRFVALDSAEHDGGAPAP